MTDIETVKAQFLTRRDVITAHHLRQPGDPWCDTMTFSILGHQLEILPNQHRALRTGSDEAHFSTDDIQELGQFIQRGFSQHVAGSKHAGIVLPRQDRAGFLFCISHHAAEFKLVKITSGAPHRVFYKKKRAGILEPNEKPDHQPYRH